MNTDQIIQFMETEAGTLLKGMILGMERTGAKCKYISEECIYFDIKEGSEIDNHDKLILARDAFKKSFGLILRVKKVKN